MRATSELLNRYSICLASLLLVVLLTGCERELGGLVKEERLERYGMTVLGQLYKVPWYGTERRTKYWCKSEVTRNIETLKKLGKTKFQMKEDGWQDFSGGGGGGQDLRSPKAPDLELNRIPFERVRFVDDKILYIDSGIRSASITFDSCKSVFAFVGDVFYREYFTQGELHEGVYPDDEGQSPPAFIGFGKRQIDKTEHHCFDMNPAYFKQPQNKHRICTPDLGKSWRVVKVI